MGSCHIGLFNGMGILYHRNGNIFYSGDFKMGVFNGIGTKFNYAGVKMYEGEFCNGNYDGFGIKYAQGHKIYNGFFKNNNYNGYGVSYINDNIEYEGIWINNVKETEMKGYREMLIEYGKKYEIDISTLLEENNIIEVSNIFFDNKESIQNSDYIMIQNLLMKLFS